RLLAYVGKHVAGHHGCLFAHRCRCFGVGSIADVAQTPDVRIERVLQRLRVYAYPAGAVGDGTVADKIRGTLWRADMQHVEGLLYQSRLAIDISGGEGGNLRRPVYLYQIMAELQAGAITLHIFHQWRYILLDSEQHATGIVEAHIDVGECTVALP